MTRRAKLAGAKRWIVKIGSSLVCHPQGGLNHDLIAAWAGQIAALMQQGRAVAVVSSGAVAEGMSRLKWEVRPRARAQIQAAAAAGQAGLVHAYADAFERHQLSTAQILLTHDDFADRLRYLNARGALRALLDLGVVPIINENDTVATDEMQLGDNDTLAGRAANIADADALLILTNRAGLHIEDPQRSPETELIHEAPIDAEQLDRAAGPSISELGRGGMITKIQAARQAALSGADCVIASGAEDDIIARVAAGEPVGTWLRAGGRPLAARKQWIAGLAPAGVLRLDAGAARALARGGNSSLLPIGVQEANGDFRRGDAVVCEDPQGRPVARGLVNYAVEDARKIIGKNSAEVRRIIGVGYEPELIHRDNLAPAPRAE